MSVQISLFHNEEAGDGSSDDEIRALLNGQPPVREGVSEPSGPRASAVPPAGKSRPRPEPGAGGMEPQPQA